MTRTPLGVWWPVALGIAAGVAVMVSVSGGLRTGGYVIAASLGLAAVLRVVLPRRLAGGLLVRSRIVDVITLLGLATMLAVLVRVVDLSPR